MSVDAATLQRLRDAQQRALERLTKERDAERAKLPADAVLWLALAPFWTPRLASDAGLPADGSDAAKVLERMYELGLCEREWTAPDVKIEDGKATLQPRERCYAMPRRQRRIEIEAAVDERGADEVAKVLGEVGNKVLAARPPAHLARWAALAAEATDSTKMLAVLDGHFERHVRDGRLSAARRWIQAARLIPRLHGGTFAAAVETRERRIELEYRRVDDRGRLEDFVVRAEQTEAIQALLRDDDAWALHFVGVAGVGKTMLVRHLVSREDELSFITARVDFDFLTLDYPLSKPVELLDRFADELRLHPDPSGLATAEFATFDKQVSLINAERRAARIAGDERPAWPRAQGTSAAAAIVGEHALQRLVEAFGRAVRCLPKRVVLLLDTCEELARLRADGSAPPSVEVTFDLLERVHACVDDVHVVFCGRRPLASSGHGDWSAPGSQHAGRPYLRLHEVRGFLKPDAKRFLERKGVPDELRGPILARTGAIDDRRRFEYPGEDHGPLIGEHRYNPYELALYSLWARDSEKPPTVADILDTKSDPYIAVRLVGRLGDSAVRDLLPVVAILGRFNRDVLESVAGIDAKRFDDLFGWLIGAEWIDAQSGGWYEVQRALRPRLLRYLRDNDGARVATVSDNLRTRLAGYIDELRLDELDISHLSAMARLLESDDEAWEWWSALEQRFVAARDWQRANDLTSMLLQDRDPESADDPAVETETDAAGPLAGPVRATYAATMRHVAPLADAATEWAAVEAWVDGNPGCAAARVLRLRAIAGRISGAPGGASACANDLERLVAAVEELGFERMNPQLTAAILAALERIVDPATPGSGELERCEMLLAAVGDLELPSSLEAFARALLAAVRLLARRPEAAWDEFLYAIALEPPRPCNDRWIDWRSPDDVGSAVRLAFVRAGFPPARVLGVLDQLDDDLIDTLEGRYLLSALFQARMDLTWVTPHEADRWREAWSTGVVDLPARPVHMTLPPLEVTLVHVVMSTGRAEPALGEYLAMRRRADRDGARAIVRGIDQLLLVQHRRFRLRDERIGAATVGRQAPQRLEQSLLWALDGLDGSKADSLFAPGRATERPLSGGDWPAWRHARWRSLYACGDSRKRDVVTWAAIALAHERHAGARESEHVLGCALDGIEANRLAAQVGYPPPCRMTFGEGDVDRALAFCSTGHARLAFRLLLRHWALTEDRRSGEEAERLAGEIGVRRAGLIALDEATMLALRLPGVAVPLLEAAARWLDAAGDVVHVLLANVTAALAAVRSGGDNAPGPWIERIEPAYRDVVAAADARMPAWEALIGPNVLETLDNLPSLVWRPWLARIAALRAYHERRDLPAIADWVAARYGGRGPALAATTELALGRTNAVGVPLPSEFDGWMGEVAPLSVEPPVGTRVGSVLRDVAALVLGLAVWALVLAGAVNLAARGTRFVWLGIAMLVGLAVCVCYALVRRWLLRRSTFVIDIQPYEPVGADSAAYETSFAVRLSGTRRRLFERFGRMPTADISVAAVARIARDRRISRTPAELAELSATLKRLASTTGRRKLDIPLVVAPTASWAPWEALLALGADPDAKSADDLLLRLRRVPLRTRPPWGKPADKRKVLTLSAGLPEANLAREWQRAGADHDGQRISDRAGLLSGASFEVLHVAAAFAESGSGVVLQTGGVPLRSSDIALRFPRLELCVLQGVTVPRRTMTSWERNQTSLMRTFAAELADFGIPAVIALPPMDTESSRRALAALAEELSDHRVFSVGRFKTALQAARSAITEDGDQAQLENAMEACLYAAGESRWFYRLMALIALDPILTSHIPAEVRHEPQREAGRAAQPRFAALPVRAHPR